MMKIERELPKDSLASLFILSWKKKTKSLLIASQMGTSEAIMIKNTMGIQRTAGRLQIAYSVQGLILPH